jgi:prolipoprotein diacylglyceryltransferase
MFPYIEIGQLRFPSYGLLLCLAILAGVRLAVTRAGRHGLARGLVYSAASLAVLVALLGAKLTDLLIHRGTLAPGVLIVGGGTFLGKT